MRPAATLRRLLSCNSPAPVAPWPPVRTAFDSWLTAELDNLRFHPHRYTSASWLSAALDLAIASQCTTLQSLRSSTRRNTPADYLDDTIDLLDACASLRDTISSIKTYHTTLSIAAHSLHQSNVPSTAAVHRAMVALDSCEAMAKPSKTLDKCGSTLRKLGERLANASSAEIDDADESICGSRVVAVLVVGMLGVGLSFKSRRGIPAVGCGKTTMWERGIHEMQREMKDDVEKRRKDGAVALRELDAASIAAKRLREVVSGGVWGRELEYAVDEVRRRCEELEERVGVIGERVEELYRQLLDIRTTLLG